MLASHPPSTGRASWLGLPVLLASAWTLLEWLRGTLFTGLGWNLLGHTQWRLPTAQLADLVGVYGVSWFVVAVNVVVWLAWRRRSWRLAAAVALLLAAAVGYGAVRRHQVERAVGQGPVLAVALLQGDIPQAQKWEPRFVQRILARYGALTRQAAQAGAQLIIWPETAVPGLANEPEVQAWLGDLSRAVQVPLLVGTPWGRWDPPVELFNSAVLMAPDGRLADRYDKMHLVPFGEFIPGESWWPALGGVRERLLIGQFTPGRRPTVFQIPPTTLSVLICFEDLFPAISRQMVRRGARVLTTITNDAWFGRTAAPIQHAQASAFRAIEHRVWMLRAANTGWTGAMDPAGRLVATVRGPDGRTLWTPGLTLVPVALGPVGPTLYTRWGDWWLLLCAAVVLLPVASRSTR